MPFAKKILVSAIVVSASVAQAELQVMDDGALSLVSGEGIGATFENVALHSSDYDQSDSLKIRLTLDNKNTASKGDDIYLEMSELRLHRTGADAGSPDSGGRFGSSTDPLFLGDLKEISESYSTLHNADGIAGLENERRSFVANYTAFPAADKSQLTLGIANYAVNVADYGITGSMYGDSGYGSHNPNSYDRIYPQSFFSSTSNISVGNFYSAVSNGYLGEINSFESSMDQASDKFDLHLRIDSVNDFNRNSAVDDQFLASLDVKGFRLYGTEAYMWVHDSKEQAGVPTRGLSFAATQGIRADAIVLNADPGGARSSQLSLNGVDIYLPLGSVDQPLTISTVQYQQVQRGTWSAPVLEAPKTQLRLEIAALPQAAVKVQEEGNIFVQSMTFGDGDDERLWVGHQDMALRDEFGNAVTVVNDVDMYAFVPRTVIYNQQINEYNQTHASAPLPYIPNENLIEIKGLEIQRLVVTTQDL